MTHHKESTTSLLLRATDRLEETLRTQEMDGATECLIADTAALLRQVVSETSHRPLRGMGEPDQVPDGVLHSAR